MRLRIIMALTVAAALSACASTPPVSLETITSATASNVDPDSADERLKALLVDEQRLNDVFGRLVTTNADLCGDSFIPTFGIRLWSIDDFAEPLKNAAQSAFALDERLQVYAVAADQPAARAGVKPGDTLISVEGRKLATGPEGRRQFAEGVTAGLLKRGAVRFTFERAGKTRRADLKALKSCPYGVALAIGDDPNAATDGATVFVTTGMMDFAHDDRDLAIVLGHEIAHALKGHPRHPPEGRARRPAFGRVFGAVIDLAAGIGNVAAGALGLSSAQRNSIAAEIEADRVGLYLAARAGYDVSNAADIWRRLDKAFPSTSDGGWTHPASSRRFDLMQATSSEIAEKRAAGEPLLPDGDPAPTS